MTKPVNWATVHRIRFGHVKRLLLDRYGVVLPDDDAGAEDLRILLHVEANAYQPERRDKVLLGEIELRAPWMPADEAQLASAIALKPLKVTSEWLGLALNVNSATRERLGIWQIGAVDLDAKGRNERRRQRDRERKRQARHRQPRAEYLANSKQQSQPWKAMASHAPPTTGTPRSRETGMSASPVRQVCPRSTASHEEDTPVSRQQYLNEEQARRWGWCHTRRRELEERLPMLRQENGHTCLTGKADTPSLMSMLRIVAPHFVAGVVMHDQIAVTTAPILAYMNGWTRERVEAYCRTKGWRVEEC
jgi:hypothetical protein